MEVCRSVGGGGMEDEWRPKKRKTENRPEGRGATGRAEPGLGWRQGQRPAIWGDGVAGRLGPPLAASSLERRNSRSGTGAGREERGVPGD